MKRFTPYGYITPIIVLLLLFVVCSVVISIVLGFTKYNIINPPVFKGLDNYERLISDPKFLKSLKNTIKLMLVIVPLQTVLGVVLAGNLISFLIPYLFVYLDGKEMGFRSFVEIVAKGPLYIVGALYLFLTLILEIPIVSFGLKKDITDRKRGYLVIGVANVLTTVMVAVIERILCYGQW